MPRDGRQKNHAEKADLQNYAGLLAKAVLQKVSNEKVFPKRSRWIIAGKIADIANDFHTCVHRANEIRVITQAERDARHYWQTMAISNLKTLNAKFSLAMDVLDIDPNSLREIGELEVKCKNILQGWMNSDIKRYGPPTSIKLLEAAPIEGDGH